MKKRIIIASSIVAGIFLILYMAFLFIVPNLVDLNSYKPEIIKSVKTDAGLDLSLEDLDFKTNPDFSITVFAKKLSVNHEDAKKLLAVDDFSVKVALFPLIFKNIEVKDVKVNNIAANFYRRENGEYKLQQVLAKLPQSEEEQEFKLVNGVDIEINKYKLQLDDYMYKTPQKFMLAGDLVKISDFNPEKFIRLETKGKFFIQDNPNINFDIKIASELPSPKKEEKKESEDAEKVEQERAKPAEPVQAFDPLEGIKKYKFKSNIVADLKIKDTDKAPDIKGFAEFDNLTLEIKGKQLPASHGKFDFKGKTFDIDSKLYITPASYISVDGNIKDIAKSKMDLAVKTTDIDLKDLKYFIDAMNEVSGINDEAIKASSLAGTLKADFKISNGSNKPDFSGYLNVLNTTIDYKGISKPLKNINIRIKFKGDKLIFDDSYGFIDQNKIALTGTVNNEGYADLKLLMDPFNLKTVFELVNESPMLAEIKPQLSEIHSLSGNIKVESDIKGSLQREIFPESKISIINPSIVPKQLGFPINMTKGIVFINENKILLNGLQANFLSSPILISGNITEYSTDKPKPDITVKIPEFRMANIKSVANSPQLTADARKLINDIKNPSGYFSANVKISPDQKVVADAKINGISLIYAPADLPVSISSGTMKADGEVLDIENINMKISNSPLQLKGAVSNLAKDPVAEISAVGRISAPDIVKYSPPDTRKSVQVRGDLPLIAQVAGTAQNWNIKAQSLLDNVSYVVDITNPGHKVLNINLKGDEKALSFNNTGLYSSSGESSSGFYNVKSSGQLISLDGGINDYSGKNPILNKVKIGLSRLNIAFVNPQGTLQLNGDIYLSGKTSNPKALGTLAIKNISVPSMSVKSSGVDIAMKDNGIFVNTDMIQVIDSKFKIDMAMKNDLSQPFVVENIDVSSPYMDSDKLQKAFPPVPNQDLPIIVNKGRFSAKQMLASGLIINNASADFVINPMNIMKIRNLKAYAAGGEATGKVDMNLKTSRVYADIIAQNMEINALATAVGLPGEVYGNMNGRIDVTTEGYTPEQTTNNAYGKIIFTVTDGKLSKLGSLSNLLKASNLRALSFASEVVENFVQLKEAKETEAFRKLTGDISLNYGVANINEITTQGGDLSMYMKGYTRLSNNYSELTILGTMSGKVAAKLGKLTNVTVDGLIEKIPGQWGEIIGSLRQKPEYPDLDKVPPLNAGPQETDRHFVVRVQGNIQNPASIRSFKFID